MRSEGDRTPQARGCDAEETSGGILAHSTQRAAQNGLKLIVTEIKLYK